MKNVQEIINSLTTNDLENYELAQYLDSPLVLIKTNAIIAVLRKKNAEISIINKLDYISQNIVKEPKVIGEWTTGHYAMAVLYLLNTKETKSIYNKNMKDMDEYTKCSIEKLIEQVPYMLE